MLPAGQQVREVYLGACGIIENANAGTLLIDCSTIDVETARAVAAAAEKKGLLMLDAPVSGGVGGAHGRHAHLHGRRQRRRLSRARNRSCEKMGKTIVHAGGAGNGQAAKICNNMILGISMIAVSEAFVLAEKLGLDHQKLFDISSKSSGQCWSMTSYCPVPGPVPASPANRDYAAGLHRGDDAEGFETCRRTRRKRRAPRRELGAEAAKHLFTLCRRAARRAAIFPGSSGSFAAESRRESAAQGERNRCNADRSNCECFNGMFTVANKPNLYGVI